MKSVVYVIQAGENGPVKIGHSRNLDSRLRSLRSGSAEPLFVRQTFEAGNVFALEKLLHMRFATERLSSEWFNVAPDQVVAAVEEINSRRSLSPLFSPSRV